MELGMSKIGLDAVNTAVKIMVCAQERKAVFHIFHLQRREERFTFSVLSKGGWSTAEEYWEGAGKRSVACNVPWPSPKGTCYGDVAKNWDRSPYAETNTVWWLQHARNIGPWLFISDSMVQLTPQQNLYGNVGTITSQITWGAWG